MTDKFKFIFAGKGIRGKVCLEYLLKHERQPVLVIAQPNDQAGMIEVAQKAKLKNLITSNINQTSTLTKIEKLNPDLLVLSGFSQILKKPAINLPKLGAINLHGGPLPQYRGASVLNWQIINGETRGGISIIFVDEGIDTGDIIAAKHFPIKSTDTIKDVINKTLKLFPPMLLKVLKQIERGTVKSVPQDKQAGRYWRKRHPEDGLINWEEMTAKQVYDFVRALTKPYPGAFTYLNKKKIHLWQVKPAPYRIKAKPGTLIKQTKHQLVIRAKDRPVIVTDFS